MKIYACLKANVRRLDDQVVGYLKRAASGEYEIQDVIALLSTPVDYGVDVKVKKSSMAIKSEATQRATELELLGGVAAPNAQNPEVIDEVLKAFGASHLRDPMKVHRDRADRENEVFEDMLRLGPDLEGIQKPVVAFNDEDAIHGGKHDSWIVSNMDRLRQNPMVLYEVLAHREWHRMQEQEKAALLPPGAALTTPQMSAGLASQPAPTLPEVQQVMLRQQQQMNPAAPQGGARAPQAPRLPKAPGQPGARPVDPNAPSGATPQAPAA
jgi:hypothetical protein